MYRVKGMEQVASWRGKVETDEYADYLVMIAKMYNRAQLAIEIKSDLGGGTTDASRCPTL